MSLFDVEQSLNKARWVLPDVEMDIVEQVARKHGLPEIVARLLTARGVPADEIEGFLNPTLREHFPDPFSMAGMEELADDLAKAITDKRKIAIFGDF